MKAFLFAIALVGCHHPDRTPEVKAMLLRAIPTGTRLAVAMARLDSLGIEHSPVMSVRDTVLAIVRNTSHSAFVRTDLQIALYFAPDSTLTRQEFKPVYTGP